MGWVDGAGEKDRLDPVKQPARHVWVMQSREYGGRAPWPGLLIEWRRNSSGKWFALVAVISGGVGNHLGVTWVAAEHLTPARGWQQPTE